MKPYKLNDLAKPELSKRFALVRITTNAGAARVLNGKIGQTFVVDKFTERFKTNELIAAVRDYRYPGTHREFQIWSIAPGDYEIIGD